MAKNDLNKRVGLIELRNKRVELDKAWETSLARKISIALLTYVVIVIFFIFAKLPNPFVNSIVPAVAFFISTLSLDYLKKKWINCKNNK
ncbi:MAG: hypothetical protein ACP5N2_00155 [Candidatus Nanoarchaeia archaeon]